ncbi:MAG: ATP-binding protein [Oscillospiraceae bacterium]|nr:ATP-binding protein [Oscillospiraceae bacterium]
MLDFDRLELYKENNRIEAKQAVGGLPQSIWETYSAFANADGGVILLGVEELKDKSLHAVEIAAPEKLVTEFWDIITNTEYVSKNILTEENVQIRRADDKTIVVICVPKAEEQDKPIYIGKDVYHGTYIRNGEGDCRCSHSEVKQMLDKAQKHRRKYD